MKNIIKKIRNYYLVKIKWRKYQIDKGFHAGRGVTLWAKNNIVIGKNCYIGRFSQIECDSVIGDNVIIANNVALVGKYDHYYQQLGESIRLSSSIRDKDYNWKGLQSSIVIEDDVWLGYGSIIMSGVRIGKGSIIAAGSVVVKNVNEYSIYGGVPAKKLSDRFENIEILQKHKKIYNEKYK
jgi:chloramphenicol O-acetyltransferase type B